MKCLHDLWYALNPRVVPSLLLKLPPHRLAHDFYPC